MSMSDRVGATARAIAIGAGLTPTATLTLTTPTGAALGAAAGIRHARLLGRCEFGKGPFPEGSGPLAFCLALALWAGCRCRLTAPRGPFVCRCREDREPPRPATPLRP